MLSRPPTRAALIARYFGRSAGHAQPAVGAADLFEGGSDDQVFDVNVQRVAVLGDVA
jgi:hypothetical protein